MTTFDLVSFSITNLRRRRNRTTLTVLGIILGAALIILMISLGLGSAAATDEMIKGWGDLTTIEVYRSISEAGAVMERTLDDAFLKSLRSEEHVLAATPKEHFLDVQGEIVTQNHKYACGIFNMIGIEASSIQAMGYELKEGAYLSEAYLGRDTIPVMAAQYAAYDFYDTGKDMNNPGYICNLYDEEGNIVDDGAFFSIDKEQLVLQIKYNIDENREDQYDFKEYKLKVVGTLLADPENRQNISGFYMNLSDMRKIENEYKRLTGSAAKKQAAVYDVVYVKVDDVRNVDKVESVLKKMGLETYSMNQVRNEMQSQALQGQLTLAGIAAVSLIVAAMNIINTMNTAILERIKEIGIMKVIGCSPAVIRLSFLIEAGFIGLSGGAIGAVCGIAFGTLINMLPEWSAQGSLESEGLLSFFGVNGSAGMNETTQLSIIPPWLIALTVLFTTLIGIVAGLAPAYKAVKVSSLEAIRNE